MAKETQGGKGESLMLRIATTIVDKRNLFFLLTILGIVFSLFSSQWVQVENNLAEYLPDNSSSRQGLDIMEEQFTTFGTAQVVVANISLEKAEEMKEQLEKLEGIQSVVFDSSADYYNHASALYEVTIDYDEKDDTCLEVLAQVKDMLEGQDVYITTALGNSTADIIDSEVRIILVYVAIIVVAVLILTSQTYAEIPVLIMTFLTAMIWNMGTNFFMGKISFVSNSVTNILQLAMSLDYAVIFCNRYKEEHETLPVREAVIVALSKAIPEISASSMTTIGGLVALMFMQFKLGPDMGICLIKAILLALVAVFLLMPGLLVVFGPLMDKTKHKKLLPDIPFVGKFAYKTRFIIPPVFLVILVAAMIISGKCPYAYGYGNLKTPKLNYVQEAENILKKNFKSGNMVAVVVPKDDYKIEARMLKELESYDEVDFTIGLSNVEAMDGYMLTDKLSPRQFSELADLDYEMAQMIYAAYAADDEDYGKIVGGLENYSVPLMDMFLFVCEQVENGLVSLDQEQEDMLMEAKEQIENGKLQLQGEDYARVLVYLTLPVSGDTTYEFLDTIQETAEKYYPDKKVYVVGNSTTEYDFQKSFEVDNTVVSIVTILIVLVVLLFTFMSVGMPILLIFVIQGAIWINFSIPTITGNELFFMSYLVVSSIQMGANIDYAIVIASRYMELKNEKSRQEAIIETMNFAFPTIVISGSILAVAGTLIGGMTSEAAIVGIGQSLGRGTIISIILVMFVLPQILLLGGDIVDKTSFKMPSVIQKKTGSGRIRVEGLVRGEIAGTVSGTMNVLVDGDVNLQVLTGTVVKEGEEKNEETSV